MRLAVSINGFNRPRHLEETLEAILVSGCAFDVFIDLDGPRTPADQELCCRCLEVAQDFSQRYPFSCYVSKAEKNRGLAASILSSIESRLRRYDFAIFLEDDIVVTSSFFHFMEVSAETYQDNPRVMQISGFNHRNNGSTPGNSYFLPFTTSWGWGTWPRAWGFYNGNVSEWMEYFKPARRRVLFDLGCGFYKQIAENSLGKKRTWAIFWYASVFKEKGLVLYPESSLVSNIGHDGSGENCKPSNAYRLNLAPNHGHDIVLPRGQQVHFLSVVQFVCLNWLARARGLGSRIFPRSLRGRA